jgi:hypothetical protein
MGELLAVSLLPEWTVFLAALLNILFIVFAFLVLPKTPEFAVLASPQAADVLARPIAIQVMVSIVRLLQESQGKPIQWPQTGTVFDTLVAHSNMHLKAPSNTRQL